MAGETCGCASGRVCAYHAGLARERAFWAAETNRELGEILARAIARAGRPLDPMRENIEPFLELHDVENYRLLWPPANRAR